MPKRPRCVQISSDRDVARTYARVKLQTELVAQAAKAAQSDCECLPQPSLRVARSARGSKAGRALATACSLALSIALLFYAGHLYLSDESPVCGRWSSLAGEPGRRVSADDGCRPQRADAAAGQRNIRWC